MFTSSSGEEPTIEVFATYSRLKNGIQDAGPGYKSVLINCKAHNVAVKA